MLVAFMLPENLMAQSNCQPKACAKSMVDKAAATTSPYLKVDFKAFSQKKATCAKKEEAKVLKTTASAQAPDLACKLACDPKDCPPDCIPVCCEKAKSTASAQKVTQDAKVSGGLKESHAGCKGKEQS
jgi:hypothetical protein